MAGSGQSRAQANREMRRAEMREQLKAKGLETQVIETIDKLADLKKPLKPVEVQRLKTANELRLKLINKYLPDVKAIELTGEEGDPIEVDNNLVIEFVNGD